MKYQAVLFDFDYTLGDATASIFEGFTFAMGEMGYPLPGLEEVRNTVGLILQDAFTLLTGEEDTEKREEFRRLYKGKVDATQAEKTVLFPGAGELIGALKEAGARLGVVSSKHSGVLKVILEHHGLLDKMSYVVGGEGVSRPKPDPEGLEAGIAVLGTEKDRVLYCGDTTIDAATAQAAGVDFCAVLNGTTPREAFLEYPHVHIAPDLEELKGWLGV